MTVRDEIAKTIIETKLEPSQNPNAPGFIMGGEVLPADYIEEIADAILARFPYTSADRTLHQYAEALRADLNTANAEIARLKDTA